MVYGLRMTFKDVLDYLGKKLSFIFMDLHDIISRTNACSSQVTITDKAHDGDLGGVETQKLIQMNDVINM